MADAPTLLFVGVGVAVSAAVYIVVVAYQRRQRGQLLDDFRYVRQPSTDTLPPRRILLLGPVSVP